MARLVMKFGGTSVGDLDRIRNVARHVKREVDAGHEVARAIVPDHTVGVGICRRLHQPRCRQHVLRVEGN